MDAPRQFVQRSDLPRLVSVYRSRTRFRLVLAAGVFDLLHAGHVEILNKAAESESDVLFVGVNSDERARELKGEGHPVVPVGLRVAVLAALRAVDHVVIFDEPTPAELLRVIRPDVYVKGDDYGPGKKPLPELEGLYPAPAVRIISGHPIRTSDLIRRAKLAK